MTTSDERSAPDEGARRGADLVGRHRRLVRRTALVSILTLVSRVLGYVREMLSAALFGHRSPIYDAFITAWRVPNLFRRFLGEGALSTAFQTTLTRVEGDHGEEAGRRLFVDTLRLLMGLLLGLVLVVMGIAAVLPDVMPVTGWHWLGADPGPVRELVVRVAPFVLLVCLAALAAGVLQVRGHFAAPAFGPAALNVVWIAVLVGLVLRYGIQEVLDPRSAYDRDMEMTRWLAWGVLAAGVAQLLVQVPALRSRGLLARRPPQERPAGSPGAMDVLRSSAPLALGAAAYQINVMIDGLMAESLLPDGGPTLHYFANRVQQFPLALVAVAATSAVFPALQAHGHAGDRRAVRDLHDRTHRAIAFVALPASFGLFALAEPVIAVSFERGAFGGEGVARAAPALRMLSLAILPAGATGLVARTYYALGDFRTPVRVSVSMLLVNVGLNVLFIRGVDMDVDGLALATAVTSWGGLLLLLPGLSRKLSLPPAREAFLGPLWRTGVAAAGSSLGAAGAWALLLEPAGRIAALLAAIGVGVGVFGGLARLLSVPEAQEIWRRFRGDSRPR